MCMVGIMGIVTMIGIALGPPGTRSRSMRRPVARGRHRWLAVVCRLVAQGQDGMEAGARYDRAVAQAVSLDCELFIRAHERPILNYLWRMTGDEDTAHDLAQEGFLRAWQRFETIRTYDQPRSWLFRVATNLAPTHLKRRSLLGGPPEMLDEERGPATSDPAWRLAERDLVRQVLLQLSPKRRAALGLREGYGLSAAEAGRALGLSEGAGRMTRHLGPARVRTPYPRGRGSAHT